MANINETYYPAAEAYAKAKTRHACPICYSPVATKRPQDKEGRCKSHRPAPRLRQQHDSTPEDTNYAYV